MTRIVETAAPARLGVAFRWLLASSWSTNLSDGIGIAAGPLLVASQTDDPLLVAMAALGRLASAAPVRTVGGCPVRSARPTAHRHRRQRGSGRSPRRDRGVDRHRSRSHHYGVLAEIHIDGDWLGGGRGLDVWDETKLELGRG